MGLANVAARHQERAALVAAAEPRGQASPPKPKPFPTLKTPIANFAKSNRPRGQFGIIDHPSLETALEPETLALA
jgi:hypothetical protein